MDRYVLSRSIKVQLYLLVSGVTHYASAMQRARWTARA